MSGVTTAQQHSVPLLEIHAVPEDFLRAWTCFELVTKAKEWDNAKQLSILHYSSSRQNDRLLD